MNRFLLQTGERWLNRQVAESTAAQAELRALDGRSMAVHVEGMGLSLCLIASDGQLRVEQRVEGASVTLRGTPGALLTLMRRDRERPLAGQFRESGAELTGSIDVAERFAEMIRLARPDLEEELSRWIGDVPAHGLATTARRVADWTLDTGRALEQNTAEYLQEESGTLPTSVEVRAFAEDVQDLRDDVERLAARIERLAARTDRNGTRR
jgi:ubiquinone biosynthesis accessory factor UbiJ